MNNESDIVTQMADNLSVTQTQINKYGNVPVFYVPKRRWLRKSQPPGLSHFIEQATTEEEVNNLLDRGKTQFKNASSKTIRQWERIAAQRIVELKLVK